MKKNQSCNALKVLKIIRIILSIILLSYSLSLCIIGHCASGQDYFPMFQNHNGKFTEEMKTAIGNRFDSENNYIFVKWYKYQYNRNYCYVLFFPKDSDLMIYGEKSSNLYDFSLYASGIFPSNNIRSIEIPNNASYINEFTGFNLSVFSGQSSNYTTNYDYISNFMVMTNNTSSAQIVLFYDDGVTIPDNDSAREDMEKPQIEDYIPDWTNTPTFDNSSVEKALESVYNGVVWLGSNIKDTITGTGEFVADTVRWSIQKVINTIRDVFSAVQDKINEIKTTVLTVIDKIQGFFDYVSQPYDSTKINTAFNNMTIKSDYNNLTTLVNNAFSVFDATAEPNTFQIPIHLERIPILHVQTVQYIDLGWLYDCRGIIRAFMWCVTTFGLLYTIIDSLPNYLSGNDE